MLSLYVSVLAYLTVRSRAKEFVELHDQVQVRVLFPADFDVLTS